MIPTAQLSRESGLQVAARSPPKFTRTGQLKDFATLAGKIPKRSQDAGCDIKITIAELVSGVREVEETGGFFVHFHRSMLVNLVDDIVVPIAAIFDLNPLCFLKDDLADRPRFWFALGLNEDFAGSSHSAEANNVFRSFPPVPKVK